MSFESPVEVRVGRYHNMNRNEKDHFYVELTDTSSGIQVASVQLTAEQFAGMVTGSGATGTATFVGAEHYANVGRYRWNAHIELECNYDGQGYTCADDRLATAAREGQWGLVLACTVRVARTRDGLRVSAVGQSLTEANAIRDARGALSGLHEFLARAGAKPHAVIEEKCFPREAGDLEDR